MHDPRYSVFQATMYSRDGGISEPLETVVRNALPRLCSVQPAPIHEAMCCPTENQARGHVEQMMLVREQRRNRDGGTPNSQQTSADFAAAQAESGKRDDTQCHVQ